MWYSLLLLGYKPVQRVTVLITVGNCNTMVLYYINCIAHLRQHCHNNIACVTTTSQHVSQQRHNKCHKKCHNVTTMSQVTSQQQCHNVVTATSQQCHNNVTKTMSQKCHNNVTTSVTTLSQQQCHDSKFVIFQEKRLKVLKCYNFL